ncbi:hypothetical protein D3H55_14070 [Bacillus salacetis]|uniref:Uncharacterized protein n=1 Tax=Bacillus salacetis TaxID=2315464 RepID=A0A3A1QVB2_9BACI|nr:hypothetical protein D3H55_14070 [Bacillus salacetis]
MTIITGGVTINDKRRILQWIGFIMVMATLLFMIFISLTGISRDLSQTTLTIIKWSGLSIGLLFVMITYWFPEEK